MWKSTSSIALVSILFIAGALSSRPVVAQDARAGSSGTINGLDMVVLVDVSGSMYPNLSTGQKGSDSERIRWDAVKLALDLLGPSDRIMIRRFNNHCPPLFDYTYTTDNGPVNYAEETGRQNAKRERNGLSLLPVGSQDFAAELEWVDRERDSLAEKISRFNVSRSTDEDDKGWLDFDGTRIVDALKTVSSVFDQQDRVRQKCIVLLTDGVDDGYDESGGFPDLEERLAVYTGRDADGKGLMPIHILGLNLDNQEGYPEKERPIKARNARDLLQRIATLSDGEFEDVESSADLPDMFIRVMRRKQEMFFKDVTVDPADNPSGQLATSQVVNGITDLGLLAYAMDPAAANPKYRIRPIDPQLEFEWVLPGGAAAPAGATYTGKEGTIHRYLYFGPRLVSNTALGASPFAGDNYQNLVTLNVNTRGDMATQRLILLKRASARFELVSPATDSRHYRHQTMDVRVELHPNDHFAPAQFKATASITHISATQGQSPPLVIPLRTTDGGFIAEQYLMDLPRTDAETDFYQISVVIDGLGEADRVKKHGLSGDRLELPRRIFQVRNSLALKSLQNVTLTNELQQGTITVETPYEVKEPIELGVHWLLPSVRDPDGNPQPIPAEGLDVTDSAGQPLSDTITLREGKEVLTFRLNEQHRLQRGIQYLPGLLTVDGPEDVRMVTPAEQRAARVGLVLGLGQIAFESAPDVLEAGPQETISGPEPTRLVLDPPDQPGFRDQALQVELLQVFPDGTVRSVPPPPKDSSDADGDENPSEASSDEKDGETTDAQEGKDATESEVEDETRADTDESPPVDANSTEDAAQTTDANEHSVFYSDEIWLMDNAGNKADGTSILNSLKPAVPFRVHLLPRRRKTHGKYRFRLRATGENFATAEADFEVSVNAPRMLLDQEELTVYAWPGVLRTVHVGAWLSTAIQGLKYPVFVDGAFPERKTVFASGNGDTTIQLPVDCPYEGQSDPMLLGVGEDHAQNVPFHIRIPMGTPSGRYTTNLELAAPDAVSARVKLTVIVNQFELAFAEFDSDAGVSSWKNGTSDESVQIPDHAMVHWLRVRNELGEPFSDLQHVVVTEAGPFRDGKGSPSQKLPEVVPARLADGGRSVLFRVAFDKPTNFSSDTYSFPVVFTDRHNRLPEAKFTFQVRFGELRDLIRIEHSRDDANPDP